MPRMILFDEFHVGVYAPRGLEEPACAAIERILNSRRFQRDLDRALRAVLRRHPALRKVRLRLSR